MMQEDVENQELLGEEQLQIITGGCDTCWELLAASNMRLGKTNIASGNARRVINNGNVELSTTHLGMSEKSMNEASKFFKESMDLQAKPGHVSTPMPEWYKKAWLNNG